MLIKLMELHAEDSSTVLNVKYQTWEEGKFLKYTFAKVAQSQSLSLLKPSKENTLTLSIYLLDKFLSELSKGATIDYQFNGEIVLVTSIRANDSRLLKGYYNVQKDDINGLTVGGTHIIREMLGVTSKYFSPPVLNLFLSNVEKDVYFNPSTLD